MLTTVDERIHRNPELARMVGQADKALGAVLGESAGLVTAEWRLAEDERRRPVVLLKLRDVTGAVEGRFAPDELVNPSHLQIRLHRLWGDLLQVRSHTQLNTLKELVQSLEEG